MKKVKVFITLKESVLDPQGQAVMQSLHNMDYKNVQDVRIGKYIELQLDDSANVAEEVDTICDKLLANTVIENYRYEIEEEVHS
ncbi:MULTISPECIES: phosphoribosylformylglycinamidine synthase subunit PurS [Sporolactobacillus]|jgi:phosphoribosylformylglycinamidine synthase|uniref:Phosphoribosylformylglycinamidine synthase subunit PurS n=3 Tax=Sporolactobacillus TaxID=2077 RepID=A0A4Y1ZA58_9BACL|nr:MULTISPECIES: phosphoribosylformylglycinamidine synthase subunit PurS [Sporolactobacillus]KLI02042.1 phosphoribosylformylglycinamidine synthase [Sporolactobacillus inulinus CASD]QAA23449.1 phosphoribosylformylglycinamidine synthase subunit PurS [Sporolactobacillus terrae]QAA26419.1 phosphoribosylformylglycinamidine synthase subunit PurS [Sporolactobacillus terrae]UAK15513.1 phosphoribosylformylglycinamidine synthase subunit PurS [Sporolactobacillus terrae]BBN99899.1 phosphoribosylformylglyc